tara:strand:+ start:2231 stop:2422 length:192 start_codon:yes stop_codon:yes gene_type:complete
MSNKYHSIKKTQLAALKRLRNEIEADLQADDRKRIAKAKQARAEERSFRDEMRHQGVQSRLWQ